LDPYTPHDVALKLFQPIRAYPEPEIWCAQVTFRSGYLLQHCGDTREQALMALAENLAQRHQQCGPYGRGEGFQP